MNRLLKKISLIAAVAVALISCRVSYSFTGASIAPEVKTFSVQQIQNIAAMVYPALSSTLTDALVDKFTRQTSLSPVKSDGDFAFEGTITGYSSTPIAVTGDEYAALNRLTITVQIKFVNKIDSKMNFSTSFSRFADYDSSTPLQSAEGALVPEIVELLVTDIFNASASNW